jgi:hypothetical protein
MTPKPRPIPFFRFALRLGMALALAVLAGCATTGRADRNEALREAQYTWSAAIRWGDFEGAWTMVDPAYREAHPLSPMELARYGEIQLSSYTEVGATVRADSASRMIQIGVVNRHTQVAREARYVEQWHYDAATEHWWVTSGLPDLWQD